MEVWESPWISGARRRRQGQNTAWFVRDTEYIWSYKRMALVTASACPHPVCWLSILRGARNGFYYGAKVRYRCQVGRGWRCGCVGLPEPHRLRPEICFPVWCPPVRFPHALLMTLLFQRGTTWQQKCSSVATATWTHSKNLAAFAFLFKAIACLCRQTRGRDAAAHTLLAGALAGGFVFGDASNPVNQQINMYIFSRVAIGGARALVQKKYVPSFSHAYTAFAASCWAAVMYLFFYQRGAMQKVRRPAVSLACCDASGVRAGSWCGGGALMDVELLCVAVDRIVHGIPVPGV